MKIDVAEYKQLVSAKFVNNGVLEEHAKIITDVLRYADSRGIPSHGIMRLPHYIQRPQYKSINASPKLQYNRVNDTITLLDGNDALGHVVGKYAMDEAMTIASKKGVGVGVVSNTTHSGAVGYYTEMAAEKNMIGLVFTQADALVAPYGGKEAYLGANPISFGAPSGQDFPLVVDISTSMVSFGKVMIEKEKGNKTPTDWGLNEVGEPTDDPAQVVALQPMAGAKGYGLSILVDTLLGVLAGAKTGRSIEPMYKDVTKKRGLGQFFLVINPALFGELEMFIKGMATMLAEIQSCPSQEGFDKVYIPGQRAQMKEQRVSTEGIEISEEQYAYLTS